MLLYLTPEQVVRLHDEEACRKYDLPGVDYGKLEPAVLRCQAAPFGEEQFPTIHEKAAALFVGLIRAHAFVSANKRTAVLATYTFYAINGFELAADPDWYVSIACAVAEGAIDIDTPLDDMGLTLVDRLAEHAQPHKYDDDLI